MPPPDVRDNGTYLWSDVWSHLMFEFGETEDVLQRPPQPEPGELIIESRLISDTYLI